jgi:signal transduction histidine kinase/ActR/RegA family two-component response regulator
MTAIITDIFRSIRSAGESHVSEKERPALYSFNTIAALTGLMVIVFGGIIYTVVPSTPFLIGLILEASSFIGLIYLNHRGYFPIAKIGMYATHACSACYFGGWLAEALPADMVATFLFVYLICSSCQVYRSWKIRSGFIAATVILSAFVYLNRTYQFIPAQHFPPQYLTLFTILCCSGMLSLMTFVTVHMVRQNDNLTKELETASLNKTQYLNETSHELRTPLNSIVGNSQFLLTYEDQFLLLKEGEEILKIVTDIGAAGKIMADMVNNQLDLAKIEAGKYDEANLTTVALTSVITTCIEINKTVAKQRGVRVIYRQDQRIIAIKSDELFLVKIVNNLLSNAIKFTDEGSEVHISAFLSKGNLVLRVKNRSCISQEKAKNFFTAYHSERNLQFGGTGLGLVITKKLVEELGGTVLVEAAGAETVFIARLPYLPAETNLNEKQVAPVSPGMHRQSDTSAESSISSTRPQKPFSHVKILIAEDDIMSQSLLRRILEQEGAGVLITETAEEAISRLSDFQPDLIISDNQMPPGKGGMGLLQYAREQKLSIPIVIASASTDKNFKKAFMDAGAENYVIKPYDNAALVSALTDILVKYSIIS